MKDRTFSLAALALLWVSLVGTSSLKPEPDPALGEALYQDSCARCHGPTGAGDGRDAWRMFPRPRNFSAGVFKFRTTASGTPPTDEDLFQTISTGLPGSRMPDFQRLPEESRWQLVHYVKGLSGAFQDQAPEPLDLGKDPGPNRADLAKGKTLYAQLGCAACHGEVGRGEGPSASTLVDNWGDPIRAADLTQGTSYRAGSSPRQIAARVMSGIDGAPMPSYAEAITSKEDLWHLAYFVHSLQEKPRFGRIVEAQPSGGPLPSLPEDPLWEKAPRTDLRLSSLFYEKNEIRPTSVTAISVRALYNEREIAFRFTWNDPNETKTAPADGLALVFLRDRRQKFQVGSLRGCPLWADAPGLDIRRWSPLEEAAEDSKASYSQGQWNLLLKRPLESRQPVLMGVAVWDGANGEEGRKRSNSNWVDLLFAPGTLKGDSK